MSGAVRVLDPALHSMLDGFGMGRQWREIGPQWDRPSGQTYSDEPFVIRWTSSMAETEDRCIFCVGCGRRWEPVYRDGRVVGRDFLTDDGQETARAVAAQRVKVERP